MHSEGGHSPGVWKELIKSTAAAMHNTIEEAKVVEEKWLALKKEEDTSVDPLPLAEPSLFPLLHGLLLLGVFVPGWSGNSPRHCADWSLERSRA